jgi:hypothetical protein
MPRGSAHASPDGWNIFAAVLQEALELAESGLGIGHLDNRRHPTSGKVIHPQKVARLQRSLRRPIFPTLNPEEIDHVVETFGLPLNQKIRLHAAVMATAIQSILAGRISPEDARIAGWQVLPIVEQQLRTHWDDGEGLGAARMDPWLQQAILEDAVDEFTAEYGAGLLEIDRGLIELQLAERTIDARERRARSASAIGAFEAAADVLRPASNETDETMVAAGIFWLEQAYQGLASAKRLQ